MESGSDVELRTAAPRRPYRRWIALAAAALTLLAVAAMPTTRHPHSSTSVANRDSGSVTPSTDDLDPETLTVGDPTPAGDPATTSTLPHTTTTVVTTTTHVDPIPVTGDPDDPEPPPVVPDKLITQFALPTKGAWPQGITTGPDGAMWFIENGSRAGYSKVSGVGRVTTDGSITEYPLGDGSGPVHIAAGPDGALWFTNVSDYIGRITTDGTVTKFAVGTFNVWDIVAGPDGALWFPLRATDTGGYVVRMTTSGQMTKFKTPHDFAVSLAFGPDGNIWIGDQEGFVSRMTPAGVFTDFPIDFEQPYGGYVGDIVPGPDGAMWFEWISSSQMPRAWLGRITLSGVASRFHLPTDGEPAHIVVGPDGYFWVSMSSDVIVRVKTDGTATSYAVQSPMGVAIGPDGDLWFTSIWGNSVGRLALSVADEFP